MIIDKVSRVHARTHTHTRNAYARTHTHTRGHPRTHIAPVGYVERYCCCVVVSPIERISPTEREFQIAPPQTFIGLSHK